MTNVTCHSLHHVRWDVLLKSSRLRGVAFGSTLLVGGLNVLSRVDRLVGAGLLLAIKLHLVLVG